MFKFLKKDVRIIDFELERIYRAQKNNHSILTQKFNDYEDCLKFLLKGRKGSERGIIWDLSEGLTVEACKEIIESYKLQIIVSQQCISELTKLQEALNIYKLADNFMISLSQFKALQKELHSVVKINLKRQSLIASEAINSHNIYCKKIEELKK